MNLRRKYKYKLYSGKKFSGDNFPLCVVSPCPYREVAGAHTSIEA